MTQTCETCRWFLDANGRAGECRRYPPTEYQPSMVKTTGFCGEWAAKDAPIDDRVRHQRSLYEVAPPIIPPEQLKAGVADRQRGENLDGSKRRETVAVEPGPWVPEVGESVVLLDDTGDVVGKSEWSISQVSALLLEAGNIFHTAEEARYEAWARRLNGFLRRMPGARPWINGENNWSVYYNHEYRTWTWGPSVSHERPGTVYFNDGHEAQAALDAAREAGLLDDGEKNE